VAEKVRIRSKYALGDLVVLTAAVRDVQRAHPGRFEIGIESVCPEVWRHNPHVTPACAGGRLIDCSEVVIDKDGKRGGHYAQAYLDLLNRKLGTAVELTTPRGDIHLSEEERNWHSDIWSLCGREMPFWLICSGGKFDIPIKWWEHRRYQEVVDALAGKVQFVQIGSWGCHHPQLQGAIDLRGKTTVRDLIHLVHYARGVLCGVTSLMHLAAAVPCPEGREREAIIIGGSREPASWEAYPGHEFLTPKEVLACRHCWKGSAQVGAEAKSDECREISHGLPRCMDLISSGEVLGKFHELEAKGRIQFLGAGQRRFARIAQRAAQLENGYETHNLTPLNAVAKADEFISKIPNYPRGYRGRGIVICAGGVNYFSQAWVCLRMLRQHGCTLPVEVWHLGRHEMDRRMEGLLRPLGARCVNAREVMNRFPMRNPLGWELKCYAILHSRFREVLSLDADNVPLADPEFLFDTPEYRRAGAIFWPDYGCLSPRRSIWELTGVPYRREPEFESGQMAIDKRRCWKPLNLAWWYNDHSEFFFRHIHGDKDTFHLAWRKLEAPYAMPAYPIVSLSGVMCQHDFIGRRIFQHRNSHKWSFFGANERVPGFQLEEDCLGHLEALRQVWDGTINGRRPTRKINGVRFRLQTTDEAVFQDVVEENEYELPPRFEQDERIIDVGAHIGSFALACHGRGSRAIICFEAHPENAEMARLNLRGRGGVRLIHAAVLDRRGRAIPGRFAEEIGRQNAGGTAVSYSATGGVPCVSMDEVLRRAGTVALVKLDCEGSEWPILMHTTEWGRVRAICGEYHARSSHPLWPPVNGGFNRIFLAKLLAANFKHVQIREDSPGSQLGKFWASNVRGFFNHARHRASHTALAHSAAGAAGRGA